MYIPRRRIFKPLGGGSPCREPAAGATPGGSASTRPSSPSSSRSTRTSRNPLTIVAERRVPFTGITTLRDVGGYATAVGGVTRSGLVFGADALHKLTPDDLDAFGELGVQTVCDLRGDVERAEFPGPVPIPPRLLTGPAGLEPAELTALREHLVDDRSSA